MRSWFDDLRYSLRALAHAPGFTLVAVLTLALGIGANTAVFSLTYALMLHKLPVHDPDGLALLTYDTSRSSGEGFGVSPPLVEDLGRRQSVFTAVMMWRDTALTLTEKGESRRIEAAIAS